MIAMSPFTECGCNVLKRITYDVHCPSYMSRSYCGNMGIGINYITRGVHSAELNASRAGNAGEAGAGNCTTETFTG